MREKSKRFFVPIVDLTFELVMTDDLHRSSKLKRRVPIIGKPCNAKWQGCCCWSHGNIILLMRWDRLSHALITHELWHVTAAAMEMNDLTADFDKCHETPAIIQEYFGKTIYKTLRQWKARIK